VAAFEVEVFGIVADEKETILGRCYCNLVVGVKNLL